MASPTEYEKALISSLHRNADRYKWLPQLYANLPPLIVCTDNLSTEEFRNPYNKKWEKLLKNITKIDQDNEFPCAQKFKKSVEVYMHRQVEFLQTDISNYGSGSQLQLTLALDDTNFQRTLEGQLTDQVRKPVVQYLYVSLLSGLIISVPEDLVLLVVPIYEKKGDKDVSFPPCLTVLSSQHLGPLYLNFYMAYPFESQGGKIVFEFHFFDSLTQSSRLECVSPFGRLQKRTRVEQSKFVKNVVNLKAFPDEQITKIGQPTLAMCDGLIENERACQVRLDSKMSIIVETSHRWNGHLVVVFTPRHKYSLGSSHQWTPAAGVFTARSESKNSLKLKVSEWLRSRQVRCLSSDTGKDKSTFCLTVLGDCVNDGVVLEFENRYFDTRGSYKAGLNAFLLAVVDHDLYKSMLLHFKQMRQIKLELNSLETHVKTLVTRYQTLGGKKNTSLVALRIKKALFYFCSFVGSHSHTLMNCIDALLISDDILLEIAHNSELIDAEEMADRFCSKYSTDQERLICYQLQGCSSPRPTVGVSFMKILSTSHTNLQKRFYILFKSGRL